MTLYHSAQAEIKKPDIRHGRMNADFGQGFYLTENRSFAEKWAAVVNIYELDTTGLLIKRFSRDSAWFDYIFGNRHGQPDAYPGYDLVIGPIANDTIYDVLGIVTSGILSRYQSLALLQVGPENIQVAVKTEKAVSQLKWISARRMSEAEISIRKAGLKAEEAAYQQQLAEAMEKMMDEE